MVKGFLVGVTTTSSFMAGLFFFKFWKRTRDFLFLAFSIAFIIEGLDRACVLAIARPNEGKPWMYLVHLFASGLILVAILKKNYGEDR
jgi:uncharacterized membrane protein HdeD (DUF308 family)